MRGLFRQGRWGHRRGSALLLCLVLLAALTLLGLAAASDRDLQLRATFNTERSAEARRAAERGLRWAEDWLFSRPGDTPVPTCRSDCAPGVPIIAASLLPANPERRTVAWWTSMGHAFGAEPVSGATLRALDGDWRVYWMLAEIDTETGDPDGSPADTRYYRVLGMAADAPGRLMAVVESIVARPWNEAAWTDPLPRAPGTVAFCRSWGPTPCGRLAWRQLR